MTQKSSVGGLATLILTVIFLGFLSIFARTFLVILVIVLIITIIARLVHHVNNNSPVKHTEQNSNKAEQINYNLKIIISPDKDQEITKS